MAACRLLALDGDDLMVISAHVQDAGVRAADILWRPQERRVVVALDRLGQEDAASGAGVVPHHTAALRFERVLRCQARGIDAAAPAAMALMALEFVPGDHPGGAVIVHFAHGGALRLDVECLECELADLA